jgi:hypothetical protein
MQPVSAIYGRMEDGSLGFTSTEIAFEDYTRCSTKMHKQSGQRRLETPVWCMDNTLLANVIATYTLQRATMSGGGQRHAWQSELSPPQKLELAKKFTKKRQADMLATLDGLCRRFVETKKQNPRDRHLRLMSEQIANLDSTLRILENCAAVCAAVVHLYYRVGFDSVGVANELKVKSCHVRQLLHRMRLVAALLGYGTHPDLAKRLAAQANLPQRIADCRLATKKGRAEYCKRLRQKRQAETLAQVPQLLAESKRLLAACA